MRLKCNRQVLRIEDYEQRTEEIKQKVGQIEEMMKNVSKTALDNERGLVDLAEFQQVGLRDIAATVTGIHGRLAGVRKQLEDIEVALHNAAVSRLKVQHAAQVQELYQDLQDFEKKKMFPT